MLSNEDRFDEMEFDVLKEIGNIGAGNATTALSQMISAKVDMFVPKVEMLAFKDLAEIIGGAETLVTGIMLTLTGDIVGSMMFMLENTAAHHLVAQMMGYETVATPETPFTEVELSALSEIGNIISGAYLTAISKLTNLRIKPAVPCLAVDMAGAILSVPAIEFGKLGDKALLIQSQFRDMDVDINGYFILIPTLESYARILKSLGM